MNNYMDRPHYIYRLRGSRGAMLYIGCTMDLPRRLKEQRNNGRFGHRIAKVEIDGPFDYEHARRVEREQIETLHPKFNAEWTPGHVRGLSPARAESRRRAARQDVAA